MIPKIIHYCWFGEKPLPSKSAKYIEGWRKKCPDFEIKEWNNRNFDIRCCDYSREAAEAGKWAFVSDVARLDILQEHGGFYLDTDIELVDSLDSLLGYDAVVGFESESDIHTGIIGAAMGNKIIKEWRKVYDNVHFRLPDGGFDLTTNVGRITKLCIDKGLKPDGSFQEIDSLTVLPKEYFCPKLPFKLKTDITEKTIAIHHFNGSWKTPVEKLRELPYFIIGLENCRKIVMLKSRIFDRIK